MVDRSVSTSAFYSRFFSFIQSCHSISILYDRVSCIEQHGQHMEQGSGFLRIWRSLMIWFYSSMVQFSVLLDGLSSQRRKLIIPRQVFFMS